MPLAMSKATARIVARLGAPSLVVRDRFSLNHPLSIASYAQRSNQNQSQASQRMLAYGLSLPNKVTALHSACSLKPILVKCILR